MKFSMKFSSYPILVLPALAVAHDAVNYQGRDYQARQVTAAATTTSSSTTSAPTGSSSSASANLTSVTLPATVSFSLEATNPTAIPLASIIPGAVSQPTQALSSTAVVGATPSSIPGAPPLPNAALLAPANYPPLDKAPPTDSPQVQQWIKDVANSGVTIPNITPTVIGGCPANPQAIADEANRCWWTCGGCTQKSDITTCPDKYTWGSTFDDGPAFHTPELLNYLEANNITSTFFVVGSRVISEPVMLQAEYMAGHQIAVHTWSHTALTTQTNEQIIAEFGWSKKVIKDVLGVTPNMMRPPYGDIDNRVRAIAQAMGLTPVIWTRISPLATFDTGDFNIAGGLTSASQVLLNWEQILNNASTINTGFIVLEHDLFQQSVDIAIGYILPDAKAHQPTLTIKPVVSCLNKPLADAYIETNDNSTNPPAISGVATTLSSGAPGSAQTTAGVSSSNKGGAVAVTSAALFTSAFAVMVGFVALFL